MNKKKIKEILPSLPTLGLVPGTFVVIKQLDTALWTSISDWIDRKGKTQNRYSGTDEYGDFLYINFDNFGAWMLYKVSDQVWRRI